MPSRARPSRWPFATSSNTAGTAITPIRGGKVGRLPPRAGPGSIAASAATKPREAARLCPFGVTIPDAASKEGSKRPASSPGVCSPKPPRREARPTSPPGRGQRVGPRHAPRAKRPGCAWLAVPRKSAPLTPARGRGQRASRRGGSGEQTPHQHGAVQQAALRAAHGRKVRTRGTLQGSEPGSASMERLLLCDIESISSQDARFIASIRRLLLSIHPEHA